MNIKTSQPISENNLTYRRGRFSSYLRPITYILDLIVINGLMYYFFGNEALSFWYLLWSLVFWFVISFKTGFYEVYRNTKPYSILTFLLRQSIGFFLVVFAFFGLFNRFEAEAVYVLKYILLTLTVIAVFKFSIFFLLRKYRSSLGGNYRKIVIIGHNKKTLELKNFFNQNPEYGYQFFKLFKVDQNNDLTKVFEYIKAEEIDEIYCSIAELNNDQINDIINFADNNLRIVKFLPDNKEIFSKRLRFDYYGYVPILSMRDMPLENRLKQLTKRVFDIVFS
ncbi:MAG: undecaprenyl-phosphate glucose phosphotransferase, partial [Flavobacteriaceae bacterium]|nr:undecaprenyl-phosphate glucose phosphotransferase [Flavobacteriaceae bacterium]